MRDDEIENGGCGAYYGCYSEYYGCGNLCHGEPEEGDDDVRCESPTRRPLAFASNYNAMHDMDGRPVVVVTRKPHGSQIYGRRSTGDSLGAENRSLSSGPRITRTAC
jgi:hypothetical protein